MNLEGWEADNFLERMEIFHIRWKLEARRISWFLP